jgi:hypothetical protein
MYQAIKQTEAGDQAEWYKCPVHCILQTKPPTAAVGIEVKRLQLSINRAHLSTSCQRVRHLVKSDNRGQVSEMHCKLAIPFSPRQ